MYRKIKINEQAQVTYLKKNPLTYMFIQLKPRLSGPPDYPIGFVDIFILINVHIDNKF